MYDMKRKIVGYHIDADSHWVAELECGHGQHVRDDPPWSERPWVRTGEGRASRLGQELNCVRCDEFARKVAEAVIKECRQSLVAAYEDAGTSGLCAERRWEMALDSLSAINLSKIIISPRATAPAAAGSPFWAGRCRCRIAEVRTWPHPPWRAVLLAQSSAAAIAGAAPAWATLAQLRLDPARPS